MRSACAVAAVLLLVAGRAQAADWLPVVKDLDHQVLRMEILTADGERGVCSAVVLNAATGYVLTAGHCVAVGATERLDLTVNGREAAVVRSNKLLDLAVVRIDPHASDVSMPLALKTPPAGSPLAVVGYAFGSKQVIVQFGHVALQRDRDDDTMRMAVDVISGDSGGAAIDEQGRLIGMISAVNYYGPMHLGVAVPVEAVRDYVKQYLP